MADCQEKRKSGKAGRRASCEGQGFALDLLAEDSFVSLKKLLEEERPAIALLVIMQGGGPPFLLRRNL